MSTIINADTSNGLKLTSDTSGEIELQANGVTKAKITANGLQDNNGNSLRGGSYRNLIINGDMRIAQRGTSTASITTGGYYTADRWSLDGSSAGTWTMSQDTDVPTGQGFATSMKWDCTTANGSLSAGSVFQIRQKIEGQNLQHLKKGTANAESVTLSFWVKSNKTGTYQVNLNDQDNARMIGNTYTINTADTWEKKTITFDGDTTGALDNDNASSLQVEWWFVAGTNFTSGAVPTTWEARVNTDRAAGQTVNLADNTSNYINITGVQLEVGEGASDFEHLPYDVQLQRCQRYYQKSHPQGVAPGAATFGGTSPETLQQFWNSGNTQLAGQQFLLKVDMRANPSATIYDYANNIGKVTGLSGGGSGTNNVTPNNIKAFHDKLVVLMYNQTYYGMAFAYTLSAEL